MENLRDFLEERDIGKENIEHMMTNKMDCSVILLMSDEQLEEYIPLYGDRLAVRDFCRRQNGNSSKDERKRSLLAKFRSRLKRRNDKDKISDSTYQSRHKGNANAMKTSRRIELGWITSDKEGSNKEVRQKTGGGTRHLTVGKSATMGEVLNTAKSLFFPNGISPRGPINNYVLELKDFQYKLVSNHTTVEDVYDRSKLRLLRFYLHTKPKETTTEDTGFTSSSSSIPSLEEGAVSKNDTEYELPFEREEIVQTSSNVPFEREEIVQTSSNVVTLNTPSLQTGSTETISSGDPEIQFGPLAAESNASINSTLPYPEPEAESPNVELQPEHFVSYKLRVHRGNSLKEFIQQFYDQEIVKVTSFDVTMVLPNGQEESGSGDGVFRDCLTGFWSEFMEQCCLGSNQKVPVIRHDFQAEEWTAVARIIFVGYKLLNYFPTFLSSSVVEEALYGKQISSLVDNFLNYIPESEKRLFSLGLEDFEKIDTDDLMDALDNHSCRSVVTNDTLSNVLCELAHKELILEPKYIVNCWSAVLQDLKSVISSARLREMYTDMEPTPRKLIKLLHFPQHMSHIEAEVANHLKRFIRELDKQLLKNFLRFCTGSDLIVQDVDKISVEFHFLEGLSRRPIGRTCGRILQLPRNYESFTVFRNEFKSVLSSDIWSMDIV